MPRGWEVAGGAPQHEQGRGWDGDGWGINHGNGWRHRNIESNSNSNGFKLYSNFDRSRNDLPELENFEIKYGFEGFEERNNFLHRNFSRFRMYFKWKIREASRFRIWIEFDRISSSSNLDETWARDLCLYLVTNAMLGKEFEVPN
jgi:hypothetical protein